MELFTAHNIELPSGNTRNDLLLKNEPGFKSIVKTLKLIIGDSGQILDLGCLEGGYTIELGKIGYQVVGMEGRSENIELCRLAHEDLNNISNIEFIQDNVLNLNHYGIYDAILCLGLLYHIEYPLNFISLMYKHVKKLLIINTHFSTYDNNQKDKLGEITENEGLIGRWYEEPISNWASIGNKRSFWPLKSELICALTSTGFEIIYEQYNIDNNFDPLFYQQKYCRTQFICVKDL